MPKIDSSKIPFTNNASYPKEFASVIAGREKQKLGDAAGLTQFGVNIARIKAKSKSALRHWHESEDEFIYVLEGELVLHELRRDRAQARRRRRLARQWRSRPLPDQSHRHGMRFIWRSAPAPRTSACITPMSISTWSATTGPPLEAQVRRTDQGIREPWPTTSSSTSMPTALRSSPGTCPAAR